MIFNYDVNIKLSRFLLYRFQLNIKSEYQKADPVTSEDNYFSSINA